MQIGHRIRRSLLRWLRIRTQGVKVMVFNDSGALLLIRNSYGDRSLFLLPGGGIDRGETPEAAAIREVREEVAIEIRELARVGTYVSAGERKRDTVHLFTARSDCEPAIDAIEIEEARFFPLEALPERVSPATRRRIAELTGERPLDGRW